MKMGFWLRLLFNGGSLLNHGFKVSILLRIMPDLFNLCGFVTRSDCASASLLEASVIVAVYMTFSSALSFPPSVCGGCSEV